MVRRRRRRGDRRWVAAKVPQPLPSLATADVAGDATVASSCRILYRLAADKELAKAGLADGGTGRDVGEDDSRIKGLFRSVRRQDR